MRILLIAIFLVFICSCASNLVTPHSAQSLIAQYGQPNAKIQLANGHSYYVYTTETKLSYPYPSTSYAGLVVGPKGQAVSSGVPRQQPDYQEPLGRCTVTFEVDKSGKVVSQQSKGSCIETDIIQSPM